jgi:hypothetical protein
MRLFLKGYLMPVLPIAPTKVNRFFFRSPFRSVRFIFNAILLCSVFAAFGIVLFRHLDGLLVHFDSFILCFLLLIQGALVPFIQSLKMHRKINDIYSAQNIAEPAAESGLNRLLYVTEDAISNGLLYTMQNMLFVAFFVFHSFR